MRHNNSTNDPYSSKHSLRPATSTAWNEEAFDDFKLWWRIVNILQVENKVKEIVPLQTIDSSLKTNFVSERNGHYSDEESK